MSNTDIADRDRMIAHQAERIDQLFAELCKFTTPPLPLKPVPLPSRNVELAYKQGR